MIRVLGSRKWRQMFVWRLYSILVRFAGLVNSDNGVLLPE
jgi:hypothetical protein